MTGTLLRNVHLVCTPASEPAEVVQACTSYPVLSGAVSTVHSIGSCLSSTLDMIEVIW